MTPAGPYHDDGRVTLYGGDALAVLAGLPDAGVDAVITDAPYSSGGMTRGDRAQGTRTKYVKSDAQHRIPGFAGDNRDQRAYSYWTALWLSEALRATRPGGACLLFTDWRQIAATIDALQAGGWVYRGIVPWHKPDARPQMGRFTAQCEYVVWGSNGPMPADPVVGCLPGFASALAPRQGQREHITQKPVSVMRELVRICQPGGLVLDPFAGSGTTGVAAVAEGRRFCGIELDPHFRQVAAERITAALHGWRDGGIQGVLGTGNPAA